MSGSVSVNAGFGWTPILVTILNLLVGSLLVAIVRTRPTIKKIANEREANLLTERAEEMREMRERMAEIETQLQITSEELRVVRHDLANANHSLDMFIALIEANPEKASEHAAKVKAAREAARAALAVEKAEVTKARVANIGIRQ